MTSRMAVVISSNRLTRLCLQPSSKRAPRRRPGSEIATIRVGRRILVCVPPLIRQLEGE